MARASRSSLPPECGFVWRKQRCRKKGDHYCEPRAQKVVDFFVEVLVHTKGDFARQAFTLDWWQEHEIVRPLFGTVIVRKVRGRWRYKRRYEIAWIEIGRKNGKTELAAGIVLYLLVADGEFSAEIYGAAKTTKQAGKVAEVVEHMRRLVPALNGDKVDRRTRKRGKVKYNKNNRRLFDESSNSYYEVIASDDADAQLGHNPHGVVIDEFLAQASRDFYDAMRTAFGARLQSIMVLLTTAGNDPESFGAITHEEMLKVWEDPDRAPHVFVYIRGLPKNDRELEQLHRMFPDHPDLPVSCDIWDERNWRWPNPALDSFLDIEALRTEALEARNDPTKENSFRQYRGNQWVNQVTRWMQLHVWDAAGNVQLVDEAALVGRKCWAGLDVSSTTDLTAWVLLFPPENETDPYTILWRFWTPEAMLAEFDEHLGGRASVWVKQGFLFATEGDFVDYEGEPMTRKSVSTLTGTTSPSLHLQIELDSQRFKIQALGYDTREASATVQFAQKLGLTVHPVKQGFWLDESLKEIMRLAKIERLGHGGHPVARWNIDSAEVKTDDEEHIKLVKPDRNKSGKRVDGVAALGDAFAVMLNPPEGNESKLQDAASAYVWTCSCGAMNARHIEVCGTCGAAKTAVG